MGTVCTTLWLFAATSGLPAQWWQDKAEYFQHAFACALMCELKAESIDIDTYYTGRATLGDGQPFTAHRVDGRWFMALESDPEQCWRGGTSQLESAR